MKLDEVFLPYKSFLTIIKIGKLGFYIPSTNITNISLVKNRFTFIYSLLTIAIVAALNQNRVERFRRLER